jgi:hypothetical protein
LDLDALSAELLAVINQTMEPTNAALAPTLPNGAGRALSG